MTALASKRRFPRRRIINKQLAAEVGASETTVKIHRHQVMEKMDAGSLADLARMADRQGVSARKS